MIRKTLSALKKITHLLVISNINSIICFQKTRNLPVIKEIKTTPKKYTIKCEEEDCNDEEIETGVTKISVRRIAL